MLTIVRQPADEGDFGISLAERRNMHGVTWISDREAGVRLLFAELLPEGEVIAPHDLESRLARGHRPNALVIDGTQLLELPPHIRLDVLALPRLLICTGMSLASMPMNLIAGPGVAVLAKPFCVEDLEAAIEWIRGTPSAVHPDSVPFGVLVQRRRIRRPGSRLSAR